MTRPRETWRHAFVDFSVCVMVAVGIVLLLACFGFAQTPTLAPYAVVEIPSHGASGTVIQTQPGRTLILSCAHMFLDQDDRPSAAMLRKPLRIVAPSPVSGGTQGVKMRVLKVDYARDLSLIEMTAGPLPYYCPVAPRGFRAGVCWSVGFDEMKADHIEPSHILGPLAKVTIGGHRFCHCTTLTAEPPWHGRSGGALIDQASGRLVGVVQGYTADGLPPWLRGEQRKAWVMRHSRGLYVDLNTIHAFLDGRASVPTPPSCPCPPGCCPLGGECPDGACPCPGGNSIVVRPQAWAPAPSNGGPPMMMGPPMGGFCAPGG